MRNQVTRSALHDLAWSTPLRDLAKRFGVSDPTLRKRCLRASIPLPTAGHWAKKHAGKRVITPALPARAPGVDEVVDFSAGRYGRPMGGWSDNELLGAMPDQADALSPVDRSGAFIILKDDQLMSICRPVMGESCLSAFGSSLR